MKRLILLCIVMQCVPSSLIARGGHGGHRGGGTRHHVVNRGNVRHHRVGHVGRRAPYRSYGRYGRRRPFWGGSYYYNSWPYYYDPFYYGWPRYSDYGLYGSSGFGLNVFI